MNITLYHQDGCPQCKMVKMQLDKKGIEYSECKDLEKMKELGFNHTPILVVDEEVLSGKDIMKFLATK